MSNHFKLIERVIHHITANAHQQPSLEELAAVSGLSATHFQKVFSDWAGVSPKQFLQFINISRLREKIRGHDVNLFSATVDAGLSGTGRLHDLFVKIEAMTPGEYANGGKQLLISYEFYDSLFGEVIVGSTSRGVCHLAFTDDNEVARTQMMLRFPNARYARQKSEFQIQAVQLLTVKNGTSSDVILHIKGTPFQMKIWEALLRIPESKLETYSSIATIAGAGKAVRAAGTAIGDNPIAYIIPCHRVIRSTGALGGYMWGTDRKLAMIGWEDAQSKTTLQTKNELVP